MHTTIDSIFKDVTLKYGDLKKPDFKFVEIEYNKSIYRDLIFKLMSRFYIKDDTDINDDVSYQISIRGKGKDWLLGISFIGSYALLLRLEGHPLVVEINDFKKRSCLEEKEIIKLIKSAGLELLGKDILETPINLTLFNTEPENVKLYQVLFSDRDLLPWR